MNEWERTYLLFVEIDVGANRPVVEGLRRPKVAPQGGRGRRLLALQQTSQTMQLWKEKAAHLWVNECEGERETSKTHFF